jgi:hypothetical protein
MTKERLFSSVLAVRANRGKDTSLRILTDQINNAVLPKAFVSTLITFSKFLSLLDSYESDCRLPSQSVSFGFVTILPPEPRCFGFLEASRGAYIKTSRRSLAGIVYG